MTAILPRDVDDTAFTPSLVALLESVPTGLCATFLDAEGETIDLATRVDGFEARIYSAELAPVLARLRTAATQLGVGAPDELRIVGERRAAVVRHVAEGCDLLLVLDGTASLPLAAQRCFQTARALAQETGIAGRRAISTPPESAEEETPRAFLEDGRVRRVAAVLGSPDLSVPVALMVRTPDGDEALIARDAATGRWYRR